MQTTIETPSAAARSAPGPRGLPLLGNALAFGRDPLGFLTHTARTYGDVARITFGPGKIYQISHPELIEQVLVTNNRTFPKEDIEQMRGSLDYLLFGTGLLTSNGEFWLRQRRLAQPAFHRQRVAGYSEATVESTQRMLAGWSDGQAMDVHEEMMRLTLEIVARTLFGSEVSAEASEVGESLGVVMDVSADSLGKPFQLPYTVPTPSNRRFVAAVRRLEAVIARMISERRATDADTGDLLSMLLHARDEDGSRMNDRQLRDELITLFLAGHETTALALSWTWYLLAQHPEAEARLHQELDRVLGGRAPTMADLPELRYTELVLRESMRLYPPAWILSGRVASRDTELGGFQIPAGSVMSVSQWVVHRDPRFFPQAERFLPERWGGDLEKQLPRFAYFPFGGGPRLCIGQAFAMMEATLILAAVAQRFRLALVPGQRVVPQPSITLRPRYGVKVRLHQR
ncbi:MAG TPA: cytochrome P450 [Roseiflexaceae bacterium]|nr:cytochrome P450 [Roseiflexaceae bacterium]